MYCSNCGIKHPKNAEYCFDCGAAMYYIPSAQAKKRKADLDIIFQLFMIWMMIFASIVTLFLLGLLPENTYALLVYWLDS